MKALDRQGRVSAPYQALAVERHLGRLAARGGERRFDLRTAEDCRSEQVRPGPEIRCGAGERAIDAIVAEAPGKAAVDLRSHRIEMQTLEHQHVLRQRDIARGLAGQIPGAERRGDFSPGIEEPREVEPNRELVEPRRAERYILAAERHPPGERIDRAARFAAQRRAAGETLVERGEARQRQAPGGVDLAVRAALRFALQPEIGAVHGDVSYAERAV